VARRFDDHGILADLRIGIRRDGDNCRLRPVHDERAGDKSGVDVARDQELQRLHHVLAAHELAADRRLQPRLSQNRFGGRAIRCRPWIGDCNPPDGWPCEIRQRRNVRSGGRQKHQLADGVAPLAVGNRQPIGDRARRSRRVGCQEHVERRPLRDLREKMSGGARRNQDTRPAGCLEPPGDPIGGRNEVCRNRDPQFARGFVCGPRGVTQPGNARHGPE
jgi:hypothetical protein